MAIVYAKVPYAYVWGDNNSTHKQGKVFPEQPLHTKKETNGWYLIEEPVLDRPVDPAYPNFWIKVEDTVESHGVAPVIPVTPVDDVPEYDGTGDMAAADAIVTLIRWFKSL